MFLHDEIKIEKAVLQRIALPNLKNNIEVYLKREDLIHPAISGNKWRKLKYNLTEAKNQNHNTLLTFGGAYSNHIYAVARAGKLFGFNTIGIIRGEEYETLNPTLEFAVQNGMRLYYYSRADYKNKLEIFTNDYIKENFGNVYQVPEGGTNNLALKGVEELLDEINIDYDYICTACGTGGTVSGLVSGLKGKKDIIGVPVLKGGKFINDEIEKHVLKRTGSSYKNYKIITEYHLGGYAKINFDLVKFIYEFKDVNNIQLDPIYTGKLLFAINDLLSKNYFPTNTKIVALHTGGIQGLAGMQKKMNNIYNNHYKKI